MELFPLSSLRVREFGIVSVRFQNRSHNLILRYWETKEFLGDYDRKVDTSVEMVTVEDIPVEMILHRS